MSNQPEYTLTQAITLYEMANEQYDTHCWGCAQCLMPLADGPFCPEGNERRRRRNKWIRRIKRVAALEGKTLCLPDMIYEKK